MRVSAGQHLGLKVSVSNVSPQEAGAPLAFRELMVGTMDTWTYGDAEPTGSFAIWDYEESTELLFAAVVEPDADRDGLGDVSQDCFPNHPFDQEFCGRDLRPPEIATRVRHRQGFLRSGVITARVSSDEAGTAEADGQLEIKGKPGRTFALRRARSAIGSDGSLALRIRIRPGALRLAQKAAREGKRVIARLRISVTDASGLVDEARDTVRPARTAGAGPIDPTNRRTLSLDARLSEVTPVRVRLWAFYEQDPVRSLASVEVRRDLEGGVHPPRRLQRTGLVGQSSDGFVA